MSRGKVSKNQIKSTGGKMEGQVKYSDPRMAFMNTTKELVIKESETLKMKDIFDVNLSRNCPIVLCEDQNGYYLTSKDRVDDLTLDVYRNHGRDKYTIRKEEDTYYVSIDGKEFVI